MPIKPGKEYQNLFPERQLWMPPKNISANDGDTVRNATFPFLRPGYAGNNGTMNYEKTDYPKN
jgi:hypothetical protein